MKTQRMLLFFTIIACFTLANAYVAAPKNIRNVCPKVYEKIFRGYVPRGNYSAGVYTEIEDVNKLKTCFLKCCSEAKCNVAFISAAKCFHITCTSNELCLPTLLEGEAGLTQSVSMILVKPTDDDTWDNVLAQSQLPDFPNEALDQEVYNILNDRRRFQDVDKEFQMEDSYKNYRYECNTQLNNVCGPKEYCMPLKINSLAGTCECKDNYRRDATGNCILEVLTDIPDLLTERIIDLATPKLNNSAPVTRKRLSVTAQSKEVKLPNDEVTIYASVTPEETTEKYQYEFTSLKQPEGSAAVKHQNGGKLELQKLIEGLYTFKVTVSNSVALGEAYVNVTVLPPSRINKPPTIIITPANQTIKQPNAAAVLDASSSIDDNGIMAWHWELQQGPLGYQPVLKDNPTLQLNDLTLPGNYTFKLTVTDTDKASSSSVANITVLKFTDYPPEANAGEDKIIYLPHNKITLNGNLSSDDHNITTWEWTKSPDDAQKAVDMQDTRTPYLQLSNLVEGMYTFSLKVTDSAGQSSTAQVHVFVKPPTNKPPIAEAGTNITISLPQTWALLDGSNSTDDNKIVLFRWEQVEGPSTVSFVNQNSSICNVTGLTKGIYLFKLSVTDDNNNLGSDTMFVIVNQNKNQKPVANAGKDFTVSLPKNVIFLNGSNSTDDWAIVKYKWTRNEKSLAVGNIGEKTDSSPILVLTDLTVGKYVFNLTVFDEQGESDTAIVSFVVKPDSKMLNLVEITLNVRAHDLNEEAYGILKGKLALLVTDGAKLHVRNVEPEQEKSRIKVIFYVETPDSKPILANEVVSQLRQKLNVDYNILGYSVVKLQSVVCQNNCSGHGICNELTRECICESFWMHDMFKVYLNNGLGNDSDCSWSVLYVVLGIISTFVLILALSWGMIFLCCNWCSKNQNPKVTNKSYKLIENNDDNHTFRKGADSDSDSDSDVVFETRSKPGRFSEGMRNGHKYPRNGFSKMGRRVKT